MPDSSLCGLVRELRRPSLIIAVVVLVLLCAVARMATGHLRRPDLTRV